MLVNEVHSYPNNSALADGLRVKLSGGYLVVADAGDDELGTIEQRVLATNTTAAVLPNLVEGIRHVVAAGAITQYATIYRAASGKVSATPNGSVWGIAIEAASGNNSVIRAQRIVASAQVNLVEAHTADDTLVAAEMYGSVHTNTGAAGTITMALPAAVVGMNFKAYVGAAQQLRLDPNGTETISLPSSGVAGAAGKYLVADAVGETVSLFCALAGTWAVAGYTGTWTAEA